MTALLEKMRARREALTHMSSTAPKAVTPEDRAETPVNTSAVARVHAARARIVSETQRVVGLPTTSYESVSADVWTQRLARVSPDKMVFPNGDLVTLRDIQAQMLEAFSQVRGGFFSVGTGWGKAWAALLLGSVFDDIDRVVVLAPASTLTNLDRERARLRPYFRLCPDIAIESFEKIQRATPEGEEDLIAQMVLNRRGDPARTLLVFDEAHRLKNLQSARGGRVMRLVQRFPELRVCVLSGSMTDNSVRDFAHLAWMALRENSPLPVEWAKESFAIADARRALGSWAAVLDVDGEPGPSDWAEITPLVYSEGLVQEFVASSGKKRVAIARTAFQRRLRKTPGVVVSSDSSLKGVALVMRGFQSSVPPEVQEALDVAINEGVDPDGNEMSDEVRVWQLRRQLSQGFFYVWDWPTGPDGKPIVDDEWKAARSLWNKHVRKELKDSATTGYDSPLLVYTHVYRELCALAGNHPTLTAWLKFVARSRKDSHSAEEVIQESRALEAWKSAGGNPQVADSCYEWFIKATAGDMLLGAWVRWSGKHKHKPQPPTKAGWVSTKFVDDVVQWARRQEAAGTPPILWYDYQEVGNMLQQRGIPCYGAGTDPPQTCQTVALSIDTHSEGKNLQPWSVQLVLSPPAGGKRWEQLLARTYRPGQKAEVVECWVSQHTPEAVEALHAARQSADYVLSQMGMAQKLLIASYQDIKTRALGSELLSAAASYEEVPLDNADYVE